MNENNNLLVRLKDCGVQKSSKWIVKGISLEIHKGKIVTLIGPNGSGKTTTAKMTLNIPVSYTHLTLPTIVCV